MDKKAKNILFRTYWKNGWLDNKQTDPADFEYAKSKGLMFDPLTISHDECIRRIFEILPAISEDKVVKAFLSSLSRRRLDWRSGLASYFIAKQLLPHNYMKVVCGHGYTNGKLTSTHYTCGICRDVKYGVIGHEFYENIDLNVLNFERIKWGGVRHGSLDYTLFDLQQLQLEDIPEPTNEDIAILNDILRTVENSEPDDYPGKLEQKLSSVLKSTKSERKIVLEILACIDILKPGSYDRPTTSKNDWTFVEYWRGKDKYNTIAVNKYFSKYL